MTCCEAALNGSLHILKWARKNGCSWYKDICAYAYGVRHQGSDE